MNKISLILTIISLLSIPTKGYSRPPFLDCLNYNDVTTAYENMRKLESEGFSPEKHRILYSMPTMIRSFTIIGQNLNHYDDDINMMIISYRSIFYYGVNLSDEEYIDRVRNRFKLGFFANNAYMEEANSKELYEFVNVLYKDKCLKN